jgi:hypothetical protein
MENGDFGFPSVGQLDEDPLADASEPWSPSQTLDVANKPSGDEMG